MDCLDDWTSVTLCLDSNNAFTLLRKPFAKWPSYDLGGVCVGMAPGQELNIYLDGVWTSRVLARARLERVSQAPGVSIHAMPQLFHGEMGRDVLDGDFDD